MLATRGRFDVAMRNDRGLALLSCAISPPMLPRAQCVCNMDDLSHPTTIVQQQPPTAYSNNCQRPLKMHTTSMLIRTRSSRIDFLLITFLSGVPFDRLSETAVADAQIGSFSNHVISLPLVMRVSLFWEGRCHWPHKMESFTGVLAGADPRAHTARIRRQKAGERYEPNS